MNIRRNSHCGHPHFARYTHITHCCAVRDIPMPMIMMTTMMITMVLLYQPNRIMLRGGWVGGGWNWPRSLRFDNNDVLWNPELTQKSRISHNWWGVDFTVNTIGQNYIELYFRRWLPKTLKSHVNRLSIVLSKLLHPYKCWKTVAFVRRVISHTHRWWSLQHVSISGGLWRQLCWSACNSWVASLLLGT